MPSERERVETLIAAARAAKRGQPPFRLHDLLFKGQLSFGLDESRYQTAVCTRRAGKTYGIAAKMLHVALTKPGCTALYVALSRINAKRIVWETLKEMNREYRLGGVVHEADLSITLPNGSRTYLSGANDRSEVDKFRGLALGIVFLDEAQSFPVFIEQLVDEVLAPALMDFNGQLVLVGTPGPVPVGYFHDKATSPEWSHHAWSVFDNPHIEKKSGRSPQSLLEDELRRRGVSADDPVIQREWFGRWVLDVNSLVFRYNPEINAREPVTHTEFVIGVDLGFDDADAIAVLGWSADSPQLDLVYEWVGAKQTISSLMGQLQVAYDKYNPLAVVADMGGLGKKIAEELQERTGIPIEAAEKERKLEHIELLNDAMRTGRLFAPSTSRFARDCQLVEWDKSNPEKWKISERFHSDVCDAVLYAFRRCQQWLYTPPRKPGPALNTPEWYEQQEKHQQQQLDEYFEQQQRANRQQQQEERELSEWL